MTDKRAYFKVDVGYFTNPKIATVLIESPTAVILHLESIAYAAQHLTDGKVPIALVQRMVGATNEDSQRLIDAGLWIPEDSGTVQVRDYLEHQRSAAEAKKLSDAGRKAAESRWNTDSDADRNANGMRNPMPREKEREKDNSRGALELNKRTPEHPIPEDWKPGEKHAEIATAKGLDLSEQAFRFRNHALANDRRQRNWNAAFNTWLSKAVDFTPAKGAQPSKAGEWWR